MPNRVIKESVRTSKSVNSMTDFQYRLWSYLITYVDDYGRGSADPEILKGFVFPRRKGVTESTIEKALADLANIGSVILYEVDGEPYFCFPNWSDHQRIQTKKSKYPAPEDGIIRKSTVNHRESPPESNPIQSEYKSESESITPPTPSKGMEEGFAEFWEAYPRKEAKEKAKQAWKKLKVDDDLLQRILDAVEIQKLSEQWTKDNGRYIPLPATWLNGKRWEDEVKPAPSGNTFAEYLAEMRGEGDTIYL